MNQTIRRLPHARIEADSTVEFFFDGRRYTGKKGDSLASALLANGVGVVGRSFKLHRPRGILGCGTEEPNALVQLESGEYTEPNVRATLIPLYPGLVAKGQNAWPSVRFDLLGAVGLCKRLLPASFYYKTFMWPNWRSWEWLVRRIAGLGTAPQAADAERYVKQNIHADVVVVGAGRSGLEAALEAARDPAKRVLLIDSQEEPGGRLLGSPVPEERSWLANALSEVAQRDNITLLCRTTVNGYYDNNVLAALERRSNHLGPRSGNAFRECFWRVFAGRVILATGAIERPLVFPNNDRPGIMLASAVREYTHRYGLTLAREIVFYTNNDSAWQVALELHRVGVKVDAIIDIRGAVDSALVEGARDAGINHYLGTRVINTKGRSGIRRLKIQRAPADGDPSVQSVESLPCELLAISGGWTPTLHLYSQSGGKLQYRESDACLIPDCNNQNISVVGRAAGEFRGELNLQCQWLTPDVPPENQWVDFQYDVTAADIQLAARENFVSVEHVKRYTTNGMSVDQGKTSNVNGLGILALATDREIPAVGTTRFRPPFHPTTIGAYAGIELGALYKPVHLLPAHKAHLTCGASFDDYGSWQRPVCYPKPGEAEAAAIAREAVAVREAVGLLDYSPLGKLEVVGPDARAFLDRVYINNMVSLKHGAARYGLMLNEAGIVIDDGVVVCLAEDHFLLHTTSGGAAVIHRHLDEWLQCEWTDLQVVVNNCTTQWATMMLSGPKARDVLQQLDCDIDLSRESFGHMQYREGHLLGQRCRILRASFTGEVSFEVSVPARYGQSLWKILMQRGANMGITPFGIEALMLLRTEKGYLHIGADTDGNTMPQDLGWGGAIARKAGDFIGSRSLSLPVGLDADRLQFTGLELLDPKGQTISGAHILSADERTTNGYVTSAVHSPNLNRTVALGIVAGAAQRQGEEVTVFYDGLRQRARLVSPCAYDPEGNALNG